MAESKIIQSINPATLAVNAEFEPASPGDMKTFVEASREAQKAWARTPIRRRLEHLLKVNRFMLSNVDDIARVITIDNGKTLLEAVNTEILPVLDTLNFCDSDLLRATSDEKLSNPIFPVARIESSNIYEPLGVIGIISPWNFPFAIPMSQIIVALALGNGVVLKPSEFTPLVGDMIKRIFDEAGLPEGLFIVAQGLGTELGDPLVEAHPDKIVFTGSVPVGRHLMTKAAEQVIPIVLELGGKDPFIVLEDADVERASSAAVWGAFVNAGQVCASVERVYVHESLVEHFTEVVIEKTQRLRLGDGTNPDVDMGPMINERRIALVEAHIGDAVAKGAAVRTGGKRASPGGLPGHFFEPTVLTGVNHTMDCINEETFGPTLPIMPFSNTAEAIDLANDSKYGLLSSVWSRSTKNAREVARRIEAGTVIINDCLFTYGFSQCPWGGVKNSGTGRTHSVHGIREFVNIKNITVSKSPLREDLWWYPYSKSKFNGMKAGMQALYCEGLRCRAGGILDALRSFNLLGNK
ncbi:MAG TPA: aldehyde dehydrogenase family protein [bacterium]|nr:aldehyde dehydrogenase family protein [bacterium]